VAQHRVELVQLLTRAQGPAAWDLSRGSSLALRAQGGDLDHHVLALGKNS